LKNCILITEFLSYCWVNSSNCINHVFPHILVPVLKEHFSRRVYPFESYSMEEMTAFPSNTSIGSMIVFARNRSVVRVMDES
jgi:hypothetical protein